VSEERLLKIAANFDRLALLVVQMRALGSDPQRMASLQMAEHCAKRGAAVARSAARRET
jgi:hypothetical protein